MNLDQTVDKITPSSGTLNIAGAILPTTALAVGGGGTGLTTLTAGYIPYGNGTSAFNSSASLTFNGTTLTVGANQAITAGNYLSFVNATPTTTAYIGNGSLITGGSTSDLAFRTDSGKILWATSGTAAAPVMTLDSSGNLLVGLTSTSAYLDGRLDVVAVGTQPGICAKLDPANTNPTQFVYSSWAPFTTGNNVFHNFETETSATIRGSISYNRAGGLVVYNTTSDYRAKTVNGLIQNALSKIALLKPSTGRMNGASEDIDFFVAHELQDVVPSAVTGKKDDLNEDNTPKYQMVDKSALIPLLTAAIQELNNKFDAYVASHP